MNFRVLVFVDTWELGCSLHDRMNLFRPVEGGESILPIRWPLDDEAAEPLSWRRTARWQKWVELRNVISRIHRAGEAMIGHPLDLGRIFFELLPSGKVMPWRTEAGSYYENYLRVHVALRTNPAALMYAGTDAHHSMIGALCLVNAQAPSCAVNFGESPRVHLVIDFRKKDAE